MKLVAKAVDYLGLNVGRIFIFVGGDCMATLGRRYREYKNSFVDDDDGGIDLFLKLAEY